MEAHDQKRLVEALAFALEAHGHQKRKGKDVPYASHLLQVAGHVLEYGGDAELAVAGLLHDVLEDCEGVDAADMRARFGDRVANVVDDCTDLLEEDTPGKKSDWYLRKHKYLTHLSQASRDTQLVAACDKLHNLQNLLVDLRFHGPETLERFSATPPQTLWYYQEVLTVLADDLPGPLLAEYALHLRALSEFVGESWNPDED